MLKNSRGISVIFLVIAMLLMITIGYVFSYLIPTKQKSVVFPVQSTQAFFIAQSGIEYAVRYAVAHNWRTTTDLAGLNAAGVYQKTLGAGRFTINYSNTAPTLDTLTSSGEVPSGTEKRLITVSNFTSFMQQHLVLRIAPPTYPAPCLTVTGGNQYQATFYFMDIDPIGSSSIILNSFRASWDVDPPPINRIRFRNPNGTTNTVFNGTPVYYNGDPVAAFDNIHTVAPQETHRVQIRWNSGGPYDFSNLIVYFYDTNGNEYTFALDPDGNGVPGC